jgi:class 3 adenylate cyclase
MHPATSGSINEPPIIASGIPHRRDDPLLRLYFQYFDIAELMDEHAKRMDKAIIRARTRVVERPDLRQRARRLQQKRLERAIYVKLWLAFLFASVEGVTELTNYVKRLSATDFKETLKAHETVMDFVAQHGDELSHLRRFRNAIFHYHRMPTKLIEFLSADGSRIAWAKALFGILDEFFQSYQVERIVVRAVVDRVVDDVFFSGK